jgi:pimeloyl-ACP methyl ester carboxylesterase
MVSAEGRLKRILILTSHGIRTNAKWQERLEDVVEEEIERRNKAIDEGAAGAAGLQKLHVTFRHNDYKFFSIFSFINPFRRRSQTRRFEERLRSYVQSDEYDEIHLVGHSFGTHIIGHSLLRIGEQLNGKVGTVILAGSVLRGTFPWDALFKKGIARLVNECGDSDLILVLNAVLPLGSGLAGRRGFAGVTGDHFRNRFFRFGHSGYFQKRDPDGPDEVWFMRKYWVPLLLGEPMTPYIDERSDSTPQLFKGWLVDQTEGLKWLVPLGLFAVLGFVFLYFALVSRTNFNLETLEMAGRVIDDVERRQMDGLQARIDARQALIEAQADSVTATLEGLIDGEVWRSYFPDQWQRARIAAKLAIRTRLTLVDKEADQVRFRGSDFAVIRTIDTDDDGGLTTVVYDLRNGKLSDSPMWAWAGPYVATTLKRPAEGDYWEGVVSLVAINLQGRIEHQLATALSGDKLSLWEIAKEEQWSAWNASKWGGARLVEAHPCGTAGDAIVLSEEGRAWVLRKDGAVAELTSPRPLVHVLGNHACVSFAEDRRRPAGQFAAGPRRRPCTCGLSERGRR